MPTLAMEHEKTDIAKISNNFDQDTIDQETSYDRLNELQTKCGNVALQGFSPAEYEVMTDVAERISAPMDHTISFQRVDGKLYCGSSIDGKDLLTISKEAEFSAYEVAKTNPQWTIEALRRHLETEEVQQAARLKSGEQMVVFSPTPDAALSGKINIGGYNTDKKTTMVRIYEASDSDEFSCRYISLDGGDWDALAAAVASIDGQMPAVYESEAMLAQRYVSSGSTSNIGNTITTHYDAAMEAKYGGVYSYGNTYVSQQSALELAMLRRDRLDEFMAIRSDLEFRYTGAELASEIERAMYDYAAALDKIARGEDVVDNGSAGGEARDSGANYSGYCASTPGQESTQTTYEAMFGRSKVTGTCPFCKETTSFDPCDPECEKCHSKPGQDQSQEYLARKKAAKEQSFAMSSKNEREPANQGEKRGAAGKKMLDLVKKFVWGDGAFSPVEKVVGYHGEIIAEGDAARELYKDSYSLAA